MEHTLISKVESLEKQTALHKMQIDELTRKMLANKSHRGSSSSSSATSLMPGCSATG